MAARESVVDEKDAEKRNVEQLQPSEQSKVHR
jgi:hypothetical protein